MANDAGHTLMTKIALEALPEWEQNIWRSERRNLEEVYCKDDYQHQKKAGRYLRMPNDSTPFAPWALRILKVPAPGKGKDYFLCGYYKHCRYVFNHYISRISGNLKKKKFKDAIRFAGILAHFIEDASTPPHAIGTDLGVDLEIIKLLIPPPDKKKRLTALHGIMEKQYAPYSLGTYSPRCLGMNPEEASFHLLERFTDMLENSIKQIVPMASALYVDDYATLTKHLTISARLASEVVADALHTTFCIAFKRFDGENTAMLSKVALSNLTPFRWTAWAPYPYCYPVVRNSNMSLDEGFWPIPLKLRVDGRVQKFDQGFGVGAPFEITYLLPEGLYRRFHSLIGLHSDSGKGGEVTFKVVLDGKTAFNSGVIKDDNARNIELNLKGAQKLSLITKPTKKSAGKFANQAVWAEPFLIGRKPI